jgi:hypothetical protein
MLIRPAIGDTDPIRYRRPTPDGQFSGNIIDEAMRPASAPIADDDVIAVGVRGTKHPLSSSLPAI